METMKTGTAVEALAAVRESAEKIKNNEPQRFPEAASHLDYFRQGDLYVTWLDPELFNIEEELEPADGPIELQLAPGDTKGSRHILDSAEGVTIYKRKNSDALSGPVMRTTCERTITHPEHGHLICPPGLYSITYQRAFADELRRVND